MLLHNRFYAFFLLFLASCAGWLLFSVSGLAGPDFTVCLFKSWTGMACPACGSTRAVEHLLHGELMLALSINPVGLIVAGSIGAGAMLFVYDLMKGTTVLETTAHRVNAWLKDPLVFGSFITLVVANWFWNISKGL